MITFEPLHPGVQAPTRATFNSAGYDLRAYLKHRKVTVYSAANAETKVTADTTLTIWPGERAMVPLGFKARLPSGYEAQVRPRSGKALKVGLCIVNAPGTIDADYPGEWCVLVVNTSSVPLVIDHEEAIAQAVLAKYEVLEWSEGEVVQSTNRTGGFGSTEAQP